MQIVGAWAAAWAGLALSASLIVAIGAQNVFVLRQGLRREHVAIVVALCAGIDVALMAAGVLGLGAAIGSHPDALRAVALVGAAFLAWYGSLAARRAIRDQSVQISADDRPAPWSRIALQTLALTLLNPHVYLDTVLLVGAVGAQQPAPLRPAFVLGAGSSSIVWFSALGFGARWLRPVFADRRAWRVLDVAVALTMWTMAAFLAKGAVTGQQ